MKQTGKTKAGQRIFENRYIELVPEQLNPLGSIAIPGRYRDVRGQIDLYKHRMRLADRRAARLAKLVETSVHIGDLPDSEVVSFVGDSEGKNG